MARWVKLWLWIREKGQGLVEYALILMFIAVVVIVILSLLGTQVSTVFSTITSALSGS
ncbi:MAG TPA: Flp family type IVb pilin [Thermoflexus sp.]|nr:Flp family type IVb pilin [Thermoflexus sp.]